MRMVTIRTALILRTVLTVRTRLTRHTTQVGSKRVRKLSPMIRMPRCQGRDILFLFPNDIVTSDKVILRSIYCFYPPEFAILFIVSLHFCKFVCRIEKKVVSLPRFSGDDRMIIANRNCSMSSCSSTQMPPGR